MRQRSCGTTSDKISAKGRSNSGAGKTFVAATVLARKGRYAEATNLLQKALASGECSEIDALDLQGRMYAQQGLYLHAESCWHRAKRLDGFNPAFDDALNRLRWGRHPNGQILRWTAFIICLFTLGLLLYQVALVNPTLANRLNGNETLLSAVRGDMARFEDASLVRSQESVASIGSLNRDLTDLDSRLFSRLNALPSSTEISRERDAIIGHLDQQSAALEKSFRHEVTNLSTFRARAEAAQVKKIETLDEAIANIGRLVVSMEAKLTNRVDAMEASIEHGIKHLPAGADVAALSHAIAKLRKKLAEIAATDTQIEHVPSRRAPEADNYGR